MKKVFAALLAVVSVFMFTSKANAEQIMGKEMNCLKGYGVCYSLDETKLYTGSAIDFKITMVDYEDHNKVLVEGEDFDRVYITTRDKNFQPPADAFENPEKYSDNDFVTPGFVIEIVHLKGKYLGSITTYNNIAEYIYIYGDMVDKWKGDKDPEFKGVYYYYDGKGYTSTDTIAKDGYKVDVSNYLKEVTREEGEAVGRYTTYANVEFSKEAFAQQTGENVYFICETVPAYVAIVNGYLNIVESEANYEVKFIDEETGNEIKETETRVGRLNKKVEVTEEDFKIDGYEFDAESENNVLSVDKLTADGATLVINFKKITENIEGQGGDDFEVVQTGSEIDYSLMTSALITASLMVIALRTKKKNN